jgi:hypothetical protein
MCAFWVTPHKSFSIFGYPTADRLNEIDRYPPGLVLGEQLGRRDGQVRDLPQALRESRWLLNSKAAGGS